MLLLWWPTSSAGWKHGSRPVLTTPAPASALVLLSSWGHVFTAATWVLLLPLSSLRCQMRKITRAYSGNLRDLCKSKLGL